MYYSARSLSPRTATGAAERRPLPPFRLSAPSCCCGLRSSSSDWREYCSCLLGSTHQRQNPSTSCGIRYPAAQNRVVLWGDGFFGEKTCGIKRGDGMSEGYVLRLGCAPDFPPRFVLRFPEAIHSVGGGTTDVPVPLHSISIFIQRESS